MLRSLRALRVPVATNIVRTLGTTPSGLFAREAYLARHDTPSSVDGLRRHRFVLDRPGPTNRLPLTGPDGATWVTIRGPVSTDDRAFTYEAVRAGLGIGVLAASGCTEHLGLIPVLPQYTLPGFGLRIVHPASRHLPQRVALFKKALIEHLSVGCVNAAHLGKRGPRRAPGRARR